MIRVLIVAEHTLLRQALREHLELEPDLQVVVEATDLPAAMAGLRAQLIDLLLLDLSSSGPSALEFLPDLKALQTNAKIIAYSLDDFAALRAYALERGADALLVNQHLARDLLPTIRQLCGAEA
jgi:DNA-binding NarL/FixJ family response regulator